MNRNFEAVIERICEADPRYKPQAYSFVMEALSYTRKKFNRPRHVSGEELLQGLKDLLMKQFGPMTMTVLRHWGVKTTEDFGHIVFHLVNNNVLTKTEDDSFEPFRNGYDFTEVFHHGYRRQLHKKISRMR